MKKSIILILTLLLVTAISLVSCENGSRLTNTTKTVRVIGTAVEKNKRSVSDDITIDSVDRIIVEGNDITDDLKPINPNVKAGDNNVEFRTKVVVSGETSFEAVAKKGYIFDSWDILDLDDDYVSEAYLDKIEDWLENNNLEHSEKLENVQAEYIPYLVAEYDNGFYIALDKTEATVGEGTKDSPFSVVEFINQAKTYNKDELTLVISGTNEAQFNKLINELNRMNNLEEVKIKTEEGVSLSTLPTITSEEITLSGITFSGELVIDNKDVEYEFEKCSFNSLTIKNANEISIKDGKASVLTVYSGEEIEIEYMEIGKLDLSNMTEGEVELKRVKYSEYMEPKSKNVEIEIK